MGGIEGADRKGVRVRFRVHLERIASWRANGESVLRRRAVRNRVLQLLLSTLSEYCRSQLRGRVA